MPKAKHRLYNKNNIKRIILFGHTGFIGSHIEIYLRNHYRELEIVGLSLPEFDLTSEKHLNDCKNLFNKNTVIIMCSAIKPNISNDIFSYQSNVQMVYNLCRVLENIPVKRFIYFSSAAVYGEDIENMKIDETTRINARSYYGIAKYTSERLIWKVFSSLDNSSSIMLRPPVIYGPGEHEITYTPSGFFRLSLSNQPITLWGDGEELREFIFIDDVVKIVEQVIFSDYDGPLNIACGKSYTFKKSLDAISEVTGINLQINSRERTKDKVDNCFDNTLLKKLIPDFIFTDIKSGIKLMLQHESHNEQ